MEVLDNLDPSSDSPDELAAFLVRQCSQSSQRAESSIGLLQYFGLQEEPFEINPDPRCLYLSRTHKEALAALEHGFSRRFTAMIAPPGMGKTTLLFRFLETIRDTAHCVFLFDIDSDCEPKDFVAYILRDIGITPGQTSSEMHEQLSGALAKERPGRKFVVVIDEAQNLSEAVLERVRLLTNFETSQGKPLQIVLSGQPQLSEKLMRPSMVQLRQRISTVCRIDPLSTEEVGDYIDYRLKQAGYHGEPLFSDSALKLIAEASQGTPRTINNLCENALDLCWTRKSKQVDSSMVAQVISDLQLIPKSEEPSAFPAKIADERPNEQERFEKGERRLGRLIPATSGGVLFWIPATFLLMISALGVFRAIEGRTPQPSKSDTGQSPQVEVPSGVGSAPAAASTVESMVAKPSANGANSQPKAPAVRPLSRPTSAAAAVPAAPDQQPLQADGSIPTSATAGQAARESPQAPTPVQPPSASVGANDIAQAGAAPAAVSFKVQIAAMAHSEDADALVSALLKRGYAATALREPGDNMFHVAVGPFSSRDEANRWREKLTEDGYNAIIKPEGP